MNNQSVPPEGQSSEQTGTESALHDTPCWASGSALCGTGDPKGNLERLVAGESAQGGKSVMTIHNNKPPAIIESGHKSGEILDLNHGRNGLSVSSLAIPNTRARRLSTIHAVHHQLHDDIPGHLREAFLDMIYGFSRPYERCPLCQRSFEENSGPILDIDRIINGGEGPPLSGDQSTEPLVEDLSGHQGEHGSRSIGLGHGSSILPNDEPSHPTTD